MTLGGVQLDVDTHFVGYSDADVLLHAITDATERTNGPRSAAAVSRPIASVEPSKAAIPSGLAISLPPESGPGVTAERMLATATATSENRATLRHQIDGRRPSDRSLRISLIWGGDW